MPVDLRTGAGASSTDAGTWADFDGALAFADRHGLPRRRLRLRPGRPVRWRRPRRLPRPRDGRPRPRGRPRRSPASAPMRRRPPPAGASTSSSGARVPGDRRRRGAVEMYDAGRFFTVTGHRLPGAPPSVEDGQAALDALYAATFGGNGHRPQEPIPDRAAGGSPPLADAEVIAKARAAKNGARFDALFLAGDTSGHGGDDSAADLAALSHLAFFTQDPAQLDRLFRRSGLMRPKWERADYRERTIAKALDRAEVWSPGTTISVNGCGPNDGGATEAGAPPRKAHPPPVAGARPGRPLWTRRRRSAGVRPAHRGRPSRHARQLPRDVRQRRRPHPARPRRRSPPLRQRERGSGGRHLQGSQGGPPTTGRRGSSPPPIRAGPRG